MGVREDSWTCLVGPLVCDSSAKRVLIQLILRRRSAVQTAFSTASVRRIAVWESTQRFYHINYTLWAVLGAIGTIGRPPGRRCEHMATLIQLTYEKGTAVHVLTQFGSPSGHAACKLSNWDNGKRLRSRARGHGHALRLWRRLLFSESTTGPPARLLY
jgi:hypothetical protein